MDPRRLQGFRDALLAERARLVQEIVEVEPEPPSEITYGSQAAAASHVFAQQRDLALRDRAERQMAQVDAALERLEEGTFGRCRSCGERIAEDRLDALPWAALCIDCQRKEGR